MVRHTEQKIWFPITDVHADNHQQRRLRHEAYGATLLVC